MPWVTYDPTAEHRRPITNVGDLLDRIEEIAELRAPEPGQPTNTTRNLANAFAKDFRAADDLGQGVFGERIPAAIMVAIELTTRLGIRDATDFATAQNLRDAVANARKSGNPSGQVDTKADSGADIEVEPDGPAEIGTWRVNGRVIKVARAARMPPSAWKLAKQLHHKGLNSRVRIADLVGVGCLFTKPLPDASVAKHGSNATKWFRDNGVALKITTDDGFIWIETTTEEDF